MPTDATALATFSSSVSTSDILELTSFLTSSALILRDLISSSSFFFIGSTTTEGNSLRLLMLSMAFFLL